MKVHYPKLYNMAHLLALNVLLLPKDLTIIFIYDVMTSNIITQVNTRAYMYGWFDFNHFSWAKTF